MAATTPQRLRPLALRTNLRGATASETMGLVASEVEGIRREVDRGVTAGPIEKNVSA